jgi:uncharacterized UPF0160 family protein
MLKAVSASSKERGEFDFPKIILLIIYDDFPKREALAKVASMSEKPVVITHSGSFQPDDVFAVAALELLLGNIELIRTRDPEIIKTGDYVVDVGLEYDHGRKRYDHHQEGGAGARENGIPYSSIGLIWKHYGEQLAGSGSVSHKIEKKLIESLDAQDNGFNTHTSVEGIHVYLIDDALDVFNPTWNEEKLFDENFKKAVMFAKNILSREIIHAQAFIEAEKKVKAAYDQSSDKRIIVLETYYPAESILVQYDEPLYVIKPDSSGNKWVIKAVRKNAEQFGNRKDFPAAWAGKRGEELAALSGISDAVFCHNNRFVAFTASKDGALKMAEIAANA